jgi:hypothetical protein
LKRGGNFFGDLGNRAELPESSGVSVERRDGGGIGARGCGAWGTRG